MTGLFAGSFDPFTIGHRSIVERALPLFDKVVIAVGYNENKKSTFPLEKRLEIIRNAFADDDRIEVTHYKGLTAEYAKKIGAGFLIRGVRSVADFESERTLADINRNLTGIETVMISALPEEGMISSSMVRELMHNGADVSKYIP